MEIWDMEDAIRNMEYEIWHLEYEIWSIRKRKHEQWNVRYGMSNVKYGLWNISHNTKQIMFCLCLRWLGLGLGGLEPEVGWGLGGGANMRSYTTVNIYGPKRFSNICLGDVGKYIFKLVFQKMPKQQ